MNLGSYGLWSGELRFMRDRGAAHDAAAQAEELGFGTLWMSGGIGTGLPLLEVSGGMLDATRAVTVATGVLSIWVQSAGQTAREQLALRARHPGRFLLGLGVSHPQLVDDATRELMRRPRTAVAQYLDALDAAAGEDLSGERVLAALRPRMLELSRTRASGSHPYFVTAAHTAAARAELGPGPLLAPEQAVVLESDPQIAREIARAHMSVYLGLPNYTGNLLAHGFDEHDLLDGGSDRLVDGVVAWGDDETVADRIREHLNAGADHVAIQVLTGRRGGAPLQEWRRLAEVLYGRPRPEAMVADAGASA